VEETKQLVVVNALMEAKSQVKLAIRQLNVQTQHCKACGMNKFVEHDERKAAEKLQGALSRIESVLGAVLEGKGLRDDV
jgi:predicted Zn-ribbon and HTH transcriptional regulator